MSKLDEGLAGFNIFLSTTTDRITPNTILLVTMVNGFILGFLTTGYLGEKSMGIFSFPFWLFVEQFVVICFFSARYVNLSTEYLNKFFLSAVIGFALQWQLFGLWVQNYEPKNDNIAPMFEGGFQTFIMGYLGLLGLIYCFKDNEIKKEQTFNTVIQ